MKDPPQMRLSKTGVKQDAKTKDDCLLAMLIRIRNGHSTKVDALALLVTVARSISSNIQRCVL